MAACAPVAPVYAQERIALIYPDAARPYRLVFDGIRKGIEQSVASSSATLAAFRLDDGDDSTKQLRAWLLEQSPVAVITLGRRASDAYATIDHSAVQIIGALDASPQTLPAASGISLSPDPGRVFDTLKDLQPSVRRVWVVADPSRDAWRLERARDAATQHGITLEVRDATDLRSAAKQFVDVFKVALPRTDALWLIDNRQLVSSKDTLPYVVEQSWNRNIAVFSNTLAHARLGVLFSVYPDPEPLGQQLGVIASRVAQGEPPPPIRFLSTLRRAVNRRVVNHLDLSVDLRQFDLVFPQR